MGYNEKSSWGKAIYTNAYMKSIEMSQKSRRWVLGPYRNENKPSLEKCRCKELISNKTKKKVNEIKSLFFRKINKIGKPLVKLTKENKEKSPINNRLID